MASEQQQQSQKCSAPAQVLLNQQNGKPASPPLSSSSSQPLNSYEDLRITGYDPLISPQLLAQELSLTQRSQQTIVDARLGAQRILRLEDDRVLAIVGPCSIHDTAAAVEYGQRLRRLAAEVSSEVLVIMRAYFEKPRTTVGWKGLINDPYMDGSFRINAGLRYGRQLLVQLTDMGVPVGCELLDTISPQFIGDLVSWGAIGARTTESQLHRELASGVSFPVGFKNGTDGNVDIAMDAIKAASHPHHFLGVTHQGLAAITRTTGNQDCHVILRGGKQGPNYSCKHLSEVRDQLVAAGLPVVLMIDCSHGNSQKDYRKQSICLNDLCQQISSGDRSIVGVMIESNLVEGNQKIPQDLSKLCYGQSVTDACVGWAETEKMLRNLQQAVLNRRKRRE